MVEGGLLVQVIGTKGEKHEMFEDLIVILIFLSSIIFSVI